MMNDDVMMFVAILANAPYIVQITRCMSLILSVLFFPFDHYCTKVLKINYLFQME